MQTLAGFQLRDVANCNNLPTAAGRLNPPGNVDSVEVCEAAIAELSLTLGLTQTDPVELEDASLPYGCFLHTEPVLRTGQPFWGTSLTSCSQLLESHITSLSECSAAAAALGLADTSAVDDGQTGATFDPPYCYFEGGVLKYNSNGQNTGSCSSSDQCVCHKGNSPYKTLYFNSAGLQNSALTHVTSICAGRF